MQTHNLLSMKIKFQNSEMIKEGQLKILTLHISFIQFNRIFSLKKNKTMKNIIFRFVCKPFEYSVVNPEFISNSG